MRQFLEQLVMIIAMFSSWIIYILVSVGMLMIWVWIMMTVWRKIFG